MAPKNRIGVARIVTVITGEKLAGAGGSSLAAPRNNALAMTNAQMRATASREGENFIGLTVSVPQRRAQRARLQALRWASTSWIVRTW